MAYTLHYAPDNASLVILGAAAPNALDFYLATLLRWTRLYPSNDPINPDLGALPATRALLERLDTHPAARAAAQAEGLGPAPFSAPEPANPSEGSAI